MRPEHSPALLMAHSECRQIGCPVQWGRFLVNIFFFFLDGFETAQSGFFLVLMPTRKVPSRCRRFRFFLEFLLTQMLFSINSC